MARPAFRGGAVQVRVPATSANLGPGFDSFGLALDLCDDLLARVADSGIVVDVAGEGAGNVPLDEGHLVVKAMRTTFERLGGQPHGLELVCANRIPHGRGLGSSAAAIVGGILLARGLVLGGDETLPDPMVLALASEIEGHPDNVAPCLLGGLTIAWTDENDAAGAQRVEMSEAIRPLVFIPPFECSTEKVRGLLPDSVPHKDASFNAGRAALLIAALTDRAGTAGDALALGKLLLTATQDRLHQPYRASAMAESAELIEQLRGERLASVVSGAGPTVLTFAVDDAQIERGKAFTPQGWRCEELAVNTTGAVQVERR